jgi:hypothetical protein
MKPAPAAAEPISTEETYLPRADEGAVIRPRMATKPRQAALVAGIAMAIAGVLYLMSRPKGPSDAILRSSFSAELPSHFRLHSFAIGKQENVGDTAAPVFKTQYHGTILSVAPTYIEVSADLGATVIAPRLPNGALQEFSGSALTRMVHGVWSTQFATEQNLLALGKPASAFTGFTVLQGSAEEAAYRAEQARAAKANNEAPADADAAPHQPSMRPTRVAADVWTSRPAASPPDHGDAAKSEEPLPLPSWSHAEVIPAAVLPASIAQPVEIPARTEINVRLATNLNSGTASVEDQFEATTVEAFEHDGRAVLPAGTVFRGVIADVERASRAHRTAKMTLAFDRFTLNGQSYPIHGRVMRISGPGLKGDAKKIGGGAGVGALIGGLLGGVKGAVAGALIGGGGTLAATNGQQVELESGTVLRVRLETSVVVR